jgi:thymidylate kinase
MARTVAACVLLVEGVPGVGKTTLLRELQRRRVEAGSGAPSMLHLSQAHTYGPLVAGEDAGTLTAAENVAHLRTVLGLVEAFVEQGRERVAKLVSMDTLHLTHCVRPGAVSWGDVQEAEARLASLDACLVFLRAQPETIWQRTVVGRRETPFLRDYAIPRFGGTFESVHEHFVQEQTCLLALANRSRLPTVVLDAESGLTELANLAYRLWMGG